MGNESYQRRCFLIFEQDVICIMNYVANVLKNGDAALHLIGDTSPKQGQGIWRIVHYTYGENPRMAQTGRCEQR